MNIRKHAILGALSALLPILAACGGGESSLPAPGKTAQAGCGISGWPSLTQTEP